MATCKLILLVAIVFAVLVAGTDALSLKRVNTKAKVTSGTQSPTSVPVDGTVPNGATVPFGDTKPPMTAGSTEVPPDAGTKVPAESMPNMDALAGMGIAVVLKNRNHIKSQEDKSAEAIEREESRKHLSEEQRRKEHYRNLNERDSQLRRDSTALEQTDRADRIEASQKVAEEQDQKQTVREQTDTRERNSEADTKKKAQLEREEKARLAKEEQGDKDRQKQRDKELEERIKKDIDERNGVLQKTKFSPQQGRIFREHKDIPFTGAYTYLFWIRPTGTDPQWTNILHKGTINENRNPAVWFFPGATRLHIRSGIFNSWNEGCDPPNALPLNTWTHVAVLHDSKGVRVFFDGNIVCQANVGQPVLNDGPLYVSDPWHPAGKCELADFRYAPRAEEVGIIQQAAADRSVLS